MWSKTFYALFVDYVMVELSWTLTIIYIYVCVCVCTFISEIFYKNLWKNVCLEDSRKCN
jgi:hypothetical protein